MTRIRARSVFSSIRAGRTSRTQNPCWGGLLASAPAVLCLLWTVSASAQEAAPEQDEPVLGTEATEVETRLIRLKLPITGDADSELKNVIRRALAQLKAGESRADERRPVLVLEFDPKRGGDGFGQGSDFERALSLARFLSSRELAGVKTVAYIPRTIKGHSVLVAMACEEIVMAPEAEMGEAGIDEDSLGAVEPGVVRWYEQIAQERRTVPVAISIGMLDKQAEVLAVETEDGTEFILSEDLAELERESTVVQETTLVPRGSLGLFSGREGRDLRMVKHLASDRDSLARVLHVSPQSLVEDQSLVADWHPIMIDVKGPITPRLVKRVETMIGRELDRQQNRVNWIGFRIDSPGGRWGDCLRLADTIAMLDPDEVRTVAYVPAEASGGATLVALACDQVVMQPGAHVGGMPLNPNAPPEIDSEFETAMKTIRESLAAKTNHTWSLLVAMVEPTAELFRYSHRKTGETRFMSTAEAKEQPDANDWRQGEAVAKPGEALRLSAEEARGLGVASQVVDNFDEFKQLYGFGAGQPREVKPNWALEFVEALASPGLAVALLVIGIVGIYIELHTPGLGLGGFIAVVAFMLFFWSKFLNGTAEWLEILLFLGGVFFLLMEMLVLPGFGIFGLGGGAMILAAIVLAGTTTWLPRTEDELSQLRTSLAVVVGGFVVALAAAMALRRYLPHAPILRDIILPAPSDKELIEREHREALADFTTLIGHQGTASTNLMPAGKATIEGRMIDVIADGDVIDRGTPVEVVSVRGTRVMVRAVKTA